MSRAAGGITATVGGLGLSNPMVTVTPKIDSVAATLGAVSPLLAGAVRVRVFDLLTHHRLATIKAAAVDFPGKRHSQKMVAARFYRFTQAKVDKNRPLDVQGKGWMPASFDQRFWDFEFGRTITARGAMVMPIGQGLWYFSRFWKLLEEKKLTVVPRPGKPPLLVQMIDRTSRAMKDAGGEVKGQQRGARMIIWGIIGRVRHQTKLLKFRESWERVQPTHLAKFDRTLDRMLTEAGRRMVAGEVTRLGGLQQSDTFVRHLKKLGDPSGSDAPGLMAKGAALAKQQNEPKGDA